jgi:hypothetical protein
VLEFDTSALCAYFSGIGDRKGTVYAWVTVSFYGHAPEMQVSRWSLPVIKHLVSQRSHNQEMKETFT